MVGAGHRGVEAGLAHELGDNRTHVGGVVGLLGDGAEVPALGDAEILTTDVEAAAGDVLRLR